VHQIIISVKVFRKQIST